MKKDQIRDLVWILHRGSIDFTGRVVNNSMLPQWNEKKRNASLLKQEWQFLKLMSWYEQFGPLTGQSGWWGEVMPPLMWPILHLLTTHMRNDFPFSKSTLSVSHMTTVYLSA